MPALNEPSLVEKGRERIEWAWRRMPVLRSIEKDWAQRRPLLGVRIGACLHVTTETANLVRTLKAGGAEVALCASNPLSTQNDVVEALIKVYEIPTFASRGVDTRTYYRHISQVLDTRPQVTMDDGADLVSSLHSEQPELLKGVIAGTEETTTGVIRLKAMEKDGTLKYPVVAINDARTKYLFDNRYGTGQSTIDGILRATNYLISGAVFVTIGYGWCGRGIAMRARGMGANVWVVEVDPIRALEAAMDGYLVTDMKEAAAHGDIFVTATGDIKAIDREHFEKMKDGALLANAGHFNVEINIKALRQVATGSRKVRENVEEFTLPDGRRIYLLAEGRLVNLACAEGHPAEVMDMSFANQALTVEWAVKSGHPLEPKVYRVPEEIDEKVARLKLATMGIRIQELTEEQKQYLGSWELGTTD